MASVPDLCIIFNLVYVVFMFSLCFHHKHSKSVHRLVAVGVRVPLCLVLWLGTQFDILSNFLIEYIKVTDVV